jgi:hypothetical protein
MKAGKYKICRMDWSGCLETKETSVAVSIWRPSAGRIPCTQSRSVFVLLIVEDILLHSSPPVLTQISSKTQSQKYSDNIWPNILAPCWHIKITVTLLYRWVNLGQEYKGSAAHVITYRTIIPEQFGWLRFRLSQVLVAHTCNPSYSDRDQEGQGSKPALGK